ncbi:hypothetical protein PILCRDRAFT_16772 [Piloderma croceum F 1598]|uniref:Dyp-type peroxidase n=1 Tax=Piloderma croceum (strain F 1598) TaxID=765440 RepID=A0A0C3EGG4_PILCF|nr:hypothetical protein PILCRDRAFT_16772 [Piloderma croceum F 1598]
MSELDLANIQGDILEGLPKKHQSFLFFVILDATQFQHRLKDIIPLITTTKQALRDIQAIKEHKAKGLLKLVGTNIAFSHTGLHALGIDDAALGDPLFGKGQLADASAGAMGLSDPGAIVGSGPTARTNPAWDPDFKKQIDGCILITGESKETIFDCSKDILTKLTNTFKIIKEVHGHLRPEEGREHFGFDDNLSQPPIKGFDTPNTGEQLTEPGLILIGEEGNAPLSGVTRPAWAKDSSFLVFRKLQQLVPEFNKFLDDNSDKNLPPKQGSELLGAHLVRRWKSGAPIDLDPTEDNPDNGKFKNRVNDFDYSNDLTAQIRCPFTAHLRKMNPRASKKPGLEFVQKSARIIRRGIPYGPEVNEHEAEAHASKHDRGLLFVCYQSDIGKGFHFIQQFWANDPNFPGKGDGHDGIIGQDINNQRTITGMYPQNVSKPLLLPKQVFVVPLGGEYFLSPSISALNTTFAA